MFEDFSLFSLLKRACLLNTISKSVAMGPLAVITGFVGDQIIAEVALSVPPSDFIYTATGWGCVHIRIISNQHNCQEPFKPESTLKMLLIISRQQANRI